MVIEQVTDVEMKSADSPAVETVEAEPKVDADLLAIDDIKEHARLIEKGATTKEPGFILRVLRTLMSTRKKLNPNVLRKVIQGFYTHSAKERDSLLSFIDEPMESDGPVVSIRSRTGKSISSPLLPEMDVYIHLLVLLHLLDHEKNDLAVKCSDLLMQKLNAQNRRTLDLLAANCYFYHTQSYELTGQLRKIRNFLHSRLRTALFRNNLDGQAVLFNCLLRNYLHYNLYSQADKLVSKSVFPESAANSECANATNLDHVVLDTPNAVYIAVHDSRSGYISDSEKQFPNYSYFDKNRMDPTEGSEGMRHMIKFVVELEERQEELEERQLKLEEKFNNLITTVKRIEVMLNHLMDTQVESDISATILGILPPSITEGGEGIRDLVKFVRELDERRRRLEERQVKFEERQVKLEEKVNTLITIVKRIEAMFNHLMGTQAEGDRSTTISTNLPPSITPIAVSPTMLKAEKAPDREFRAQRLMRLQFQFEKYTQHLFRCSLIGDGKQKIDKKKSETLSKRRCILEIAQEIPAIAENLDNRNPSSVDALSREGLFESNEIIIISNYLITAETQRENVGQGQHAIILPVGRESSLSLISSTSAVDSEIATQAENESLSGSTEGNVNLKKEKRRCKKRNLSHLESGEEERSQGSVLQTIPMPLAEEQPHSAIELPCYDFTNLLQLYLLQDMSPSNGTTLPPQGLPPVDLSFIRARNLVMDFREWVKNDMFPQLLDRSVPMDIIPQTAAMDKEPQPSKSNQAQANTQQVGELSLVSSTPCFSVLDGGSYAGITLPLEQLMHDPRIDEKSLPPLPVDLPEPPPGYTFRRFRKAEPIFESDPAPELPEQSEVDHLAAHSRRRVVGFRYVNGIELVALPVPDKDNEA